MFVQSDTNFEVSTSTISFPEGLENIPFKSQTVHTKKRSSFSPEKMSIDGRSSPSPSPSASGVSSEIIEVLRVGLVAASTVIVLVLNRSGAM